jgi:urease accessory protein
MEATPRKTQVFWDRTWTRHFAIPKDLQWIMLLELLHLADSALPVGATAHSYGIETLAEEGVLSADNLESFFCSHLAESGQLEAVFVRRAWRGEDVTGLNREFDARRPARESREASFKTGRRFTELVRAMAGVSLPAAHYPIAFGAAGAALHLPEEPVVLAYLQQSLSGLVSVCQRLLPVGQVAANRLIWNLRPAILNTASNSERLETHCFTPLPEIASMRHRFLETRLFIS